ncbi:MAG TPA: DUF2160 family membrane protein [Dongiaceae bacterium]|jgi:predicted small integral membrane protein|nr:DUF2160 family membrane protein [Dongiaceae bacterium]
MEWMAWTWTTAFFFLAMLLLLSAMTVWEIVQPSRARRGLIPMRTHRGDRLFIGLLTSAYVHLAWLLLIPAPLWGALIVSLCLIGFLLRWG